MNHEILGHRCGTVPNKEFLIRFLLNFAIARVEFKGSNSKHKISLPLGDTDISSSFKISKGANPRYSQGASLARVPWVPGTNVFRDQIQVHPRFFKIYSWEAPTTYESNPIRFGLLLIGLNICSPFSILLKVSFSHGMEMFLLCLG